MFYSVQQVSVRNFFRLGLSLTLFRTPHTHTRTHHKDEVYVKVRGHPDRLKAEADRINHPMALDPMCLKVVLGGGVAVLRMFLFCVATTTQNFHLTPLCYLMTTLCQQNKASNQEQRHNNNTNTRLPKRPTTTTTTPPSPPTSSGHLRPRPFGQGRVGSSELFHWGGHHLQDGDEPVRRPLRALRQGLGVDSLV